MALFIVTMLVATFYFLVLDRSEFRERFFAWSARTFGTEAGCCTYVGAQILTRTLCNYPVFSTNFIFFY